MNDWRRDSTPSPPPGPLPHGGSLVSARRLFPGAPEPWLDLSTGINPFSYPLAPLPIACLTRLPEPAALAALEAAAADAYGVADPACVVAAPGTQILIELLPRLFPQPDVAVLAPTYAEHGHAWAKVGTAVRLVPDFAELARSSGAVLCNPNNPDGRRTPPDDVLGLAERLRLLVVDEAFADLEDGISIAPALPHPAIVVLRSFGKTYGLAGLRLGFALAAPARAAAIRAALGPWAVSGPAIFAGLAALPDRAWRNRMATRLGADAGTLDAMLAAAGLRPAGGTRLFRLAESEDAPASFARLGRAGILVRRFDDRPDRLRFGQPGSPAAFARLGASLAGLQGGAAIDGRRE